MTTHGRKLAVLTLFTLLAACSERSTPPPVQPGTGDGGRDEIDTLEADGKFCNATAQAVFEACKSEALAAQAKTRGDCVNVTGAADRQECVSDADSTREEDEQVCSEQLEARKDACEVLGEDRYDPAFAPRLFDSDFAHLTKPNRYFPLTVGSRWEYHSESEVDLVEVTNETKLIEGVPCLVVRDTVLDDGVPVEMTDDWFAAAKDGTVWYCGEETKDFEVFEGDNPQRPELVSIDGSFKAGREGDKPGIIFLAAPAKGQAYREEFSLGNAEDVAEILAVDYSFGTRSELDELVPRELADLFCAAKDCVVTKNFSLLEPGLFERKYYAPGIGLFLEVNPGEEEVLRLVSCNVDRRCSSL